MKEKIYPESKVEVRNWEVPFYDLFLNVATAGQYASFIAGAVRAMKIGPDDRILDLGAGTGRNARLIIPHLSGSGDYLGMDISRSMVGKFARKCAPFPNARIIRARLDREFPLRTRFDKIFISFVLHGLPHGQREKLLERVGSYLKDEGQLFILDYNEFSLNDMPWYLRLGFKYMECPYAFDFIARDWKEILRGKNMNDFRESLFFSGYVRLLRARRKGE
ncbi:MAG: class I SAM-dependent methyltransferase [Candidatus Auribacterota bacterium]|nr:class I SAM-dependent methyltransferase [Candidatus Auribacterota bacterium]